MKIGQHLYQNQQGQQSNPGDQTSSSSDYTAGNSNNENN
jgi:hypothetical protein